MTHSFLNLGCGTRTSDRCINVDWSVYLRMRKLPGANCLARMVLSGPRLQKYRSVGQNVVAHDLRKGIPFPSASVDAVYHSHFLEHIDRCRVPVFLQEVLRVLRPGGIHRLVVPDSGALCRAYVEDLDRCREGPSNRDGHESYIANIIEQMVRTEAFGTSQQRPARRFIENLVLGDARSRGEAHRWMYDEVSLACLLESVGFVNVIKCTCRTSGIREWAATRLDVDEYGNEYKPESLYIECRKKE